MMVDTKASVKNSIKDSIKGSIKGSIKDSMTETNQDFLGLVDGVSEVSDDELMNVSKRLIEKNRDAYEVLAK